MKHSTQFYSYITPPRGQGRRIYYHILTEDMPLLLWETKKVGTAISTLSKGYTYTTVHVHKPVQLNPSSS